MAYVVAATWKAKPGEADHITEVIRIMTPLSARSRAAFSTRRRSRPTNRRRSSSMSSTPTPKPTRTTRTASTSKHVFRYAIDYLAERGVQDLPDDRCAAVPPMAP